MAKIERVKAFDISGYHHDIIGGLIIDNQLAVAVIDKPARRILRFVKKRVYIGIFLILAVSDLELIQATGVNERYEYQETAYNIFTLFKIIVFSHFYGW